MLFVLSEYKDREALAGRHNGISTAYSDASGQILRQSKKKWGDRGGFAGHTSIFQSAEEQQEPAPLLTGTYHKSVDEYKL